jgi:hypothetical protein
VSLLTIVQSISQRVLKTTPAFAASSTDPNVQQIIGMVNEDGQEVSARHSWQGLINEASFVTQGTLGGILTLGTVTGGSGYASGYTSAFNLVPLTGGHGSGATATIEVENGVVNSVTLNYNAYGSGYQVGDVLSAAAVNLGGTGSGFSIPVATIGIVSQQVQGTIQDLAGEGFRFILNETMWDRTTRRPIFGPKSPAEWQQLQAQFMQGPYIQYRLRTNQVMFLPAPAVGDEIFFEWVTSYWMLTAEQVPGSIMTNDTDVSVLDERLHILGGIWRWRKANGLDYTEDWNKYEAAVADSISRDGSKARLNLAGAQSDIFPAILVPAGNWPIVGTT